MTANTPNLPSQYDPKTTEAKWQHHWEAHQVFQAQPQQGGESFCIVIPPPNVTGSLHMGHAFNTSLIDTVVRFHRMKGDNTLCLPGTDHASIAVQTIIEKQLKAEGKTRNDLGREKFLERAWQWRQESGGRIVNQLKRLGLSADWSRERFTLDENLCESVKAAFIKLYEEGLIYRGNYLVNWCPESQSAVSDLEVENQEVNGHLWHFRYPLKDGEGFVEVATTRPETMLGDTAVAVNPQDDRYRHLIGQTLLLPLVNREIPIVGDEFVDPEFGTGCVKVTPAHDPNDFAMGQRHELPMINIMNKDGSLNENAGDFAGQDRFEARKNVVQALDDLGLLGAVEDYAHSVPFSDRGKVPVEPLLSTQWFVKIRPLADKALNSLDQEQDPQFVPDRWKKVYRDWLVKLNDWCISRQLWWGHQIPAWYVVSETDGQITDQTPFVVAPNEQEAIAQAQAEYGADCVLEQDPDVLDTWFSSGLWPFSTLGWPEETDDLAVYYPNTTMVTGFDIIFFWVARMTMMASHFTDQIPFKDVYIHGLVRDENGKKMSKSANNGIDPLILIDKYGTDALRYTLIREVAGAGQDISLQYDRQTDESPSVEASRNFANKLWNAARFVMMNLDGQSPAQLGAPDVTALELSDRWILSRFNQVVAQTRGNLETYALGEAAKDLYEFIWGDFCDQYIELVKTRLYDKKTPQSKRLAQQTIAYVLEGILKLLHPFMPHITEEIWHTLTGASDHSLAQQPYPRVDELLALAPPPQIPESLAPSAATPGPATPQPIAPPDPWPLDSVDDALNLVGALPRLTGDFLAQQKNAIATMAVIFGGLLALKVGLAVGGAFHSIPLASPFFETVGLLFSGWFAVTNLRTPDQRRALATTWNQFFQELWPQTPAPAASPIPERSPQPLASLPSTLINEELETNFQVMLETIRTIRNLRAEAEIKPGLQVAVILQSENPQERAILEAGRQYIQDLAKVAQLTVTPQLDRELKQAFAGVVGTIQVLMPLEGLADVAALKAKLEKNLGKIDKEIQSLQGRLNNPGFVNKAPEAVIQTAKDNLQEAQTQGTILRERLQRLQ